MLIDVIFSLRMFFVVVIFWFLKLFLIDNVEQFLYPHFITLKKTDQGNVYNFAINL